MWCVPHTAVLLLVVCVCLLVAVQVVRVRLSWIVGSSLGGVVSVCTSALSRSSSSRTRSKSSLDEGRSRSSLGGTRSIHIYTRYRPRWTTVRPGPMLLLFIKVAMSQQLRRLHTFVEGVVLGSPRS